MIAGAEENPELKEYGVETAKEKSAKDLSTEALLFSENSLKP